jgi:hypothetical protein
MRDSLTKFAFMFGPNFKVPVYDRALLSVSAVIVGVPHTLHITLG